MSAACHAQFLGSANSKLIWMTAFHILAFCMANIFYKHLYIHTYTLIHRSNRWWLEAELSFVRILFIARLRVRSPAGAAQQKQVTACLQGYTTPGYCRCMPLYPKKQRSEYEQNLGDSCAVIVRQMLVYFWSGFLKGFFWVQNNP